MLAHHLFIGRDVDAVNLVLGHEAFHPLNLWSHVLEDAAGLLRDGLELCRFQVSRAGDFAFDDVFWHLSSPV